METPTYPCPQCGTPAASNAVYCTACGAAVSHTSGPLTTWLSATSASHPGSGRPLEPGTADTVADLPRPTDAAREMIVPTGAPSITPPTTRFTAPRLFAAAAVLTAVVVITVLALAWQSETDAHHAAAAKAASLAAQLRSVRDNLAQVQAIARKRRAVLLQAGSTLGKVDPLLTRVDGVKKAAARDAQAYGTWADSLASAYNYLNDSSYLSLDVSYLNSLISDANSQLAKANAADAAYGRAVNAFGNDADSFTQSVRALQRQLKSVTTR